MYSSENGAFDVDPISQFMNGVSRRCFQGAVVVAFDFHPPSKPSFLHAMVVPYLSILKSHQVDCRLQSEKTARVVIWMMMMTTASTWTMMMNTIAMIDDNRADDDADYQGIF